MDTYTSDDPRPSFLVRENIERERRLDELRFRRRALADQLRLLDEEEVRLWREQKRAEEGH